MENRDFDDSEYGNYHDNADNDDNDDNNYYNYHEDLEEQLEKELIDQELQFEKDLKEQEQEIELQLQQQEIEEQLKKKEILKLKDIYFEKNNNFITTVDDDNNNNNNIQNNNNDYNDQLSLKSFVDRYSSKVLSKENLTVYYIIERIPINHKDYLTNKCFSINCENANIFIDLNISDRMFKLRFILQSSNYKLFSIEFTDFKTDYSIIKTIDKSSFYVKPFLLRNLKQNYKNNVNRDNNIIKFSVWLRFFIEDSGNNQIYDNLTTNIFFTINYK